jgi:hypothetical protein
LPTWTTSEVALAGAEARAVDAGVDDVDRRTRAERGQPVGEGSRDGDQRRRIAHGGPMGESDRTRCLEVRDVAAVGHEDVGRADATRRAARDRGGRDQVVPEHDIGPQALGRLGRLTTQARVLAGRAGAAGALAGEADELDGAAGLLERGRLTGDEDPVLGRLRSGAHVGEHEHAQRGVHAPTLPHAATARLHPSPV